MEEGKGVTPLWLTEAKSGVRARVCASQKAPERTTDRQIHDASNVHHTMIVAVIIINTKSIKPFHMIHYATRPNTSTHSDYSSYL